ncbi:MAG: TIGR00730 family Rossman fold protein [Pseudomonadota bacterium]
MWPNSLAVYCGASASGPPAHAAAARSLGRLLADEGVTLVYGGAKSGLMGQISDATLAAGGSVCGVIPDFLDAVERTHEGVSELVRVDSMHARKRVMTERADAFCILPGGIGTLDEVFEAITWGQLGLHAKPLVFLDCDGYWDPLYRLLLSMGEAGYLRVAPKAIFQSVSQPEEVLPALRARRAEPSASHLERS